MLVLYNLISIIGLIFYLPRLLSKKGPESRASFIRERLGMSDYDKTDIWIHAVSVGETLACLPFLKRLKKEFPHKKILLSTTTYTGQKVAHEKFPEADRIMYIPLDTVLCVKRVVKRLKPAVFATVETELWPALFHSLKKSGSRVVILNGRISHDSFRGYRRIRFFMKNILSQVDFFYMQERVYADRILSLGADRHKVGVMGNFKFDIDFREEEPLNWLSTIGERVFLAASTHRGEEETILEAYNSIRKRVPGAKLLLAPRHPERFDEAADIMERRGMDYIRRSAFPQEPVVSGQLASTNAPGDKESAGMQVIDEHRGSDRNPGNDNSLPEIILLDTIGELSRVFSKSSVAFIGGSLVPSGGHNMLEPAYWSKPIIFGPHMDNFPIAGEFLLKSAALEVKDSQDIAEAVIELMTNNEKAVGMGANARAIVEKNTGAVNNAVELIRGYLGTA